MSNSSAISSRPNPSRRRRWLAAALLFWTPVVLLVGGSYSLCSINSDDSKPRRTDCVEIGPAQIFEFRPTSGSSGLRRRPAKDIPKCSKLPYLSQIETDLKPFPRILPTDISLEKLNETIIGGIQGSARFILSGSTLLHVPNPFQHTRAIIERTRRLSTFLTSFLSWYASNVSPTKLYVDVLFYLEDVPPLNPDGKEVRRYWAQNWKLPEQIPSKIPYFMFTTVAGTGAINFPFFDTFGLPEGVKRSRPVRKAGNLVPFTSKQPVLVFRGSNTGPYKDFGIEDPPRSRLVRICSSYEKLCDAGFTQLWDVQRGMAHQMNATFGTKPLIPITEMAEKYQFVGVIDGNSWSDRFGVMLHGNAVVFKQDSPFREFFYSAVEKGVHYCSLKADVSDVVEKVEWARGHQVEMEEVARQAREFADAYLNPEAIFCYVGVLLEEYMERQQFEREDLPGEAKVVAERCGDRWVDFDREMVQCLGWFAGLPLVLWIALFVCFWTRVGWS